MPTFLHAVCGVGDKTRTTREFSRPEWQEVRMDTDESAKPDVVSSLLDMNMLKDGTFDAAFTSRSLERLYSHEVGPALANLRRVLSDTGYLIVACSDLQLACALIAEDKLLDPAYESPSGPVSPLDILYGYRPAIAAGHVNHARRCGFTVKALIGSLVQAGFASVWGCRRPEIFTILAIACKAKTPGDTLKEMAKTHFG